MPYTRHSSSPASNFGLLSRGKRRGQFPERIRDFGLCQARHGESCLPELARLICLIARYVQPFLKEPAVNVSRTPHFDCSDAALVTALQTDGFAVVRHRFGYVSSIQVDGLRIVEAVCVLFRQAAEPADLSRAWDLLWKLMRQAEPRPEQLDGVSLCRTGGRLGPT